MSSIKQCKCPPNSGGCCGTCRQRQVEMGVKCPCKKENCTKCEQRRDKPEPPGPFAGKCDCGNESCNRCSPGTEEIQTGVIKNQMESEVEAKVREDVENEMGTKTQGVVEDKLQKKVQGEVGSAVPEEIGKKELTKTHEEGENVEERKVQKDAEEDEKRPSKLLLVKRLSSKLLAVLSDPTLEEKMEPTRSKNLPESQEAKKEGATESPTNENPEKKEG